MHRTMRTLTVAAAALALLVASVPSHAAPNTRAATLTLRLVSVTTQVKVEKDVAPKQVVSKGDVFWQQSLLRNAIAQFGRPKGAVVGSDTGTITVVSRTLLDNKGVAVLPGGTIRFEGRAADGARALSLGVTGGTGRYAGARGTLEVKALTPDGTRTSNVYRLTLP
jgi:hypothetical protein